MPASDYSYVLDAAEIDRYRALARRALERERLAWARAGIVPGAAVVDLGCGPGALLCALAERTAPGGLIVGVDEDASAVEAAQRLLAGLGLDHRARVMHSSIQDSGLDDGVFDVALMRNVLVHNGARAHPLLH